jgi:GcrA cell cycle regulator
VNTKREKFWEINQAQLKHYAEVEGLTAREISIKLGVTKNAVTGRAVRTHIQFHRKPMYWELKQQRRANAREAQLQQQKQLQQQETEVQWRRQWKFPPSGRCMFPLGDPRTDEFKFCGDKVIEFGSPYCVLHHKRAYSYHKST